MKLQSVAAAILAIALVACGGGGSKSGGPSSPTEPTGPTGPTNQLVIDVVLVAQDVGAGLQVASLTLDGRELSRPDWSGFPGGSCKSDCHVAGTATDISTGAHTVKATVVSQSRATVTYLTLGAVTFADSSGSSRQITLPAEKHILRAGDSLSYSITL
jgi:hypothetical protein